MHTPEEEEFVRSALASAEELHPDMFPTLATLSSAFFYQFIPVAKQPEPPEIVFLPHTDAKPLEVTGALASWNHLWEAAQYKREVFNTDSFLKDLPSNFRDWISSLPAANIWLIADDEKRYEAYGPLFHLLPKRLLDRHGLPALKRPLWPNNGVAWWKREHIPADFTRRLSRAFAEHVWGYIDSGSGLRSFTPKEPLTLLSHNLDFWLPHALGALEGRMRLFKRVKPETTRQRRLLARAKAEFDPDVAIERPRQGGTLWMGEEEASEITSDLINLADHNGNLRGLIDAVRSNRVVDDFSPLWSFAREDFERKLYSKRAKVKVTFVEISDTLPVHNPQSEYTDDLLWGDFFSVLDPRERKIVVCLRSGTTKLTDIASSLGYANHSPVSKALSRIRRKAATLLGMQENSSPDSRSTGKRGELC